MNSTEHLLTRALCLLSYSVHSTKFHSSFKEQKKKHYGTTNLKFIKLAHKRVTDFVNDQIKRHMLLIIKKLFKFFDYLIFLLEMEHLKDKNPRHTLVK